MEGIGEQPAESSEKWASWVCVFAEPSVGNESGKVNYTAALSHAPRMRAAPFSGRGIGVRRRAWGQACGILQRWRRERKGGLVEHAHRRSIGGESGFSIARLPKRIGRPFLF
ncbi:hypothetical protein C7S16_0380 [Burkholderia thailandensis]|uniref:Uncharacterized protein n=1 Tax=Burkholderia thailandensis TaxID=57975 RepID=A0AAW9CT03_BURTH|nr:hypothetical protein [Burkholderia thailandensis]MDW9254018.1 hypothetical protein [Burkholderia thailandensis]